MPVVSIAQIARAILLANAMATSIRGFLANIHDSHAPSGIVLRPSQFKRDIAPMIKSRRMSACPAFDMRPSRSFPPDECCRGTRPNQAAKSRPRRKLSMGGANASTANALIGPTPGIVCKRRAVSVSDASAPICFAFPSIRCVFSDLQQKIAAFVANQFWQIAVLSLNHRLNPL